MRNLINVRNVIKNSHKNDLTSHIKTHPEKNIYHCRVCDKAFMNVSHLTEHLKIHSLVKSYKCSDKTWISYHNVYGKIF